MLTCMQPTDPETGYARYVRECAMLADFGTSGLREGFIRQHALELGRLASWLLEEGDDNLDQVFADAARMREGALPRTLTGLRVAMPRWYTRRVRDPLGVWAEAARSRPTGAAEDPVCHMLVDPGTTAYKIFENGRQHYFCCPHCLAVCGDRVLRTA